MLLQVALVFPNSDPVMFMVAFYGCLLAELVPVPIEVPLTRKVVNSLGPTGPGPVRSSSEAERRLTASPAAFLAAALFRVRRGLQAGQAGGQWAELRGRVSCCGRGFRSCGWSCHVTSVNFPEQRVQLFSSDG